LPIVNNIEVQFVSKKSEIYFEQALDDTERPLIVNSFHYSAYRSLLPYFLLRNCDVHVIAAGKGLEEKEKMMDFFIAICRELYGIQSKATFINVDDPLSLLKIYEHFTAKNHEKKQILLIYADGNLASSKRNNDNVNLLKIKLCGANIHIRQGMYALGSVLQSPVINVLTESCKDKILIHVGDYYDFKYETINIDDFSVMLFNHFMTFLKRENLSSWDCIMYLHSWIEKKEILKDRLVDKITFEKDRYTYFELDNKKYVFDAKYFLSLEVESNRIKDIVLKNNFYL
jgi:hypothetical protein